MDGNAPQHIQVQRKSIIGRILVFLLILLIALGGFVYALFTTHWGLRFALKIPTIAGVSIHAEHPQGTMIDGFTIDHLHIVHKDTQIDIDSVIFDWDASQLRHQKLMINHVAVGDMAIVAGSNPNPRQSKPVQFPRDIGLPLSVEVKQISVGKILWGQEKTPLIDWISAQYSYDLNGDKKHLLHVASDGPIAHIGGDLTLDNHAPFQSTGSLLINKTADKVVWRSHLDISGDLHNLQLKSQGEGGDMSWEMDGVLSPFAPSVHHRLAHLEFLAHNINPQFFWSGAPWGKINLTARLRQDNQRLLGDVLMKNTARTWGEGIPLKNLQAAFWVGEEQSQTIWGIQGLSVQWLNKGFINVSGMMGKEYDFSAQLRAITLADFIRSDNQTPLNGMIYLKGKTDVPQLAWQLARDQLSADGSLRWKNNRLTVDSAHFNDGQKGTLNVEGFWDSAQKMHWVFNPQGFNPQSIDRSIPSGTLNGKLTLDAQAQKIHVVSKIKESTWANLPLAVTGDVHYADGFLDDSQFKLLLGKNTLDINGTFGRIRDKLNINVSAPSLSDFGFGLKGNLVARGYASGEIKKLAIALEGKAQQFAMGNLARIDDLDFLIHISPNHTEPLNVDIRGQNLYLSGQKIETLNAQANGTLAQHTLSAHSAVFWNNKPFNLTVQASGGLNNQALWNGTVSAFDLGGAMQVSLQKPAQISASGRNLSINQSQWSLLGGYLSLDSFVWQKEQGLTSRGNVRNLHLEQVNAVVSLPVTQNLVLSADWDMHYAQDAVGRMHLWRERGDIVIPGKTQTLGLEYLDWQGDLAGSNFNHHLVAQTRFGGIDGVMQIGQIYGNNWAVKPISGQLKVAAQDLSKLKYFLPVGMTLGGNLYASLGISGTFKVPVLSGQLDADGLSYQDFGTGIHLQNGVLRSHFNQQQWLIDQLNFRDTAEGTLAIKGRVAQLASVPDVNLSVQMNHYRVLRHPDRTVQLSGEALVHYADAIGVALTGKLRLDQAHFDFPKSAMPSLDEDVHIIGASAKEHQGFIPIAVDLQLDLNDAFRFSGKGLNVLMGGTLNLKANAHEDFKLLGVVNVVDGSYKAYGQDLQVDRGQISFVGPIANPMLNIRASRRISAVNVGMEVTGSVEQPRVVLFSDTPMSDKDKLSYLVLGRASAGESDDAALAAAAGSVVASGINEKIGLFDDVGLGGRSTRNPDTGEMNPAEQMIVVGKHLSNKIYLGYEYGISSATQAMKMIFQVSRLVQLIGRVGSDSVGGEIRFSKRFD